MYLFYKDCARKLNSLCRALDRLLAMSIQVELEFQNGRLWRLNYEVDWTVGHMLIQSYCSKMALFHEDRWIPDHTVCHDVMSLSGLNLKYRTAEILFRPCFIGLYKGEIFTSFFPNRSLPFKQYLQVGQYSINDISHCAGHLAISSSDYHHIAADENKPLDYLLKFDQDNPLIFIESIAHFYSIF